MIWYFFTFLILRIFLFFWEKYSIPMVALSFQRITLVIFIFIILILNIGSHSFLQIIFYYFSQLNLQIFLFIDLEIAICFQRIILILILLLIEILFICNITIFRYFFFSSTTRSFAQDFILLKYPCCLVTYILRNLLKT